MTKKEFADRVKKLRAGTGLSQPAFARQVGVRVWTLRTWEQGRYAPEYAELILEAVTARVAGVKGMTSRK